MINTATCPRCGTENRADAMNCVACRINLKFAQEHPAEIARIKQEDTKREKLEGWAFGNALVGMPASKEESILLPGLLLLGSFAFAFCLGEAVHELGHFLTHRAYGFDVQIILDPFGGSKTLGSSSPREIWGITSAGGPFLNLLVSLVLLLFLRSKRRPALLPLLLWGPIALVQEGVTLSLGMLTPGGDAELIVDWGVPAAILVSLGVLLLASGVTVICWLLPLVNLSPADSFSRKFSVVTSGMVSFMVLRLLCSSLLSPDLASENAVPLIFSLLLATIVVLLYDPLYPILNRTTRTEPASVTWPATVVSIALGMGMILFQLVSFRG